MFTKRESRIVLLLAGALLVGTLVNLYGRFRHSSELEPSMFLSKGTADLAQISDFNIKPASENADSGEMQKISPGKIKINSAPAPELISISGVGPVLAQRIIEYREKNGKFNGEKDLLKVKGIGPVKIKKLLEQIEFD